MRSNRAVLTWWLGAAILAVAGCGLFSSEPERQWYKPGGHYTVEEFKRDKTACATSGKLDVECMKAKGWFYFGADIPPEPPASPGQTGKTPAKR